MGAAEAHARGAHAAIAAVPDALPAQPRDLGLQAPPAPHGRVALHRGGHAGVDQQGAPEPVPGALIRPARPPARHPPPDRGGGDRTGAGAWPGGGPPHAGPALAH